MSHGNPTPEQVLAAPAVAMDPVVARRELVRGLQLAYSGEWGAVRAYLGHRHALCGNPEDRNCITQILKDELRHRRDLLRMLRELGSAPDPRAERKLNAVGYLIATFCRIGGWFWPMYGAGALERDNIVEYEIAARLAWHAGLHQYVDPLLHYAEVEWDHEHELRTRAQSHWLWNVVPGWKPPAPRNAIRESFAEFASHPVEVQRRKSWLVR